MKNLATHKLFSCEICSGRFFHFGFFVIALTFLFACLSACNQTEPNQQKNHKIFAGQSIVVMLPKVDAVREPIIDAAIQFEAETGATIRVITPSWKESATKVRQSLANPNSDLDIYMVVSMWNGELLGGHHIEPISDEIKKQLDWDDVLPVYRNNILTWGGVAYGYPYDGDSVHLFYRKDLFANKLYQDKFFKRYGYPLAPPNTWDAFYDVAQFFTGWDWDHDGKPNYGLTGGRLVDRNGVGLFISQAAAFAKHPDDLAYYFDRDTLKPRINNPGFVKALTLWVDTLAFGSPQILNFSNLDARNDFISGQAAMLVDWADTPVHAADAAISSIKNKVGYAQLPASQTVYNPNTHQWDKRFNRAASVSGNWTLFVDKNSKHKALAMQFASMMTSQAMTAKLVADSRAVSNPSRYSHLSNQAIWLKAGFDAEEAKLYTEMIKQSIDNPNMVYDLNIPYASEYFGILDNYIYLASQKKLSPQEALDKTAEEWEKLTDKIGRKQQIAAYEASLNLIKNTSTK